MIENNKEIKVSEADSDVRVIVFEELDKYFSDPARRQMSTSELVEDLRFRYLLVPGFSKEKIELCVSKYQQRERDKSLSELLLKLAHSGQSLDESHKIFVEFLRPALAEPLDAETDAWVLMHFIWQVKRRMLGLDVRWHLCPVFMSREQGTGKSEFVRNLCLPFGLGKQVSFAVQKTLGELADERELAANLSRFVVFLDELSGASKAEWSKLKSIITAEILQPRILGTNIQDMVKNKSTFIATANADSMDEKIKDDTGNRRFYPIKVKNFVNIPAFCCEQEVIRSMIGESRVLYPLRFDSTPLWQLVDAKWEFFLPVSEIQRVQAGHRAQDEIECFIESLHIQSDDQLIPAEWIESGILHTAFKRFAPKSHYARSQKLFTRRLGALLGIRPEAKAGPSRNRSGFKVSLSRDVLNEHLKNSISG